MESLNLRCSFRRCKFWSSYNKSRGSTLEQHHMCESTFPPPQLSVEPVRDRPA